MKKSSLKSLFSLLFLVGTVSIALYCILTKDTISLRIDMPGGVSKPISPFSLLPPTLFAVGAYFVTRFLADKPIRVRILLRRSVIPMNEHNAALIRNFHESVSLGVTGVMFYCTLFMSGIIVFNPFITGAIMMLPSFMIGWSSFKLLRDREMQ